MVEVVYIKFRDEALIHASLRVRTLAETSATYITADMRRSLMETKSASQYLVKPLTYNNLMQVVVAANAVPFIISLDKTFVFTYIFQNSRKT